MTLTGFCGLRFPVVDRRFVHTDLLSHLGLEQTEIEPVLAEVVAYRTKLSWIGLWEWLSRFEAQMAIRQRNGVGSNTLKKDTRG